MGQHFLHDTNTIKKIASTVKRSIDSVANTVANTDVVGGRNTVTRIVEIGPGGGSLTCALRDLVAPSRLTCVEIDSRMRPIDRVDWVQQDALLFDYKPDDYVTGNLPYNVSVPILLRLCHVGVSGWCVMVQREVARKIVATAGKEYGRLAVMMQARFGVHYQFTVPPSVFVPRPRVDSAIVSGVRAVNDVNLDTLDMLLRQVFQCRRKALRNVVSTEVLQVFQQFGVDGNVRADAIPAGVMYAVSRVLNGTN